MREQTTKRRKQKTENREQSTYGVFYYSLFSDRSSRRLSAGFTLIELLVVCAIIVIVTAVVLVNHNRYGGEVLLQSFSYDVALSIREAQVYGISVQGSGCSTNSFHSAYGIHFNSSAKNSANTQYVLFADCNGDGVYEPPPANSTCGVGTDCLLDTFNITRGYKISALCAPAVGCTSSLGTLDIAFQRPEPDAKISANGSSCLSAANNCEPDAQITLISPRGDMRNVTVQGNGQIGVAQADVVAP